ncbi:hypothetical protein [Streptococcus chenjunshii]|nr:hypothetical protein [Streptococcus chenjunshii]
MKKSYLSFLSASIFILYGIFASKYSFIGLGLVFIIIGLADRLKK